MKHSFTSHALKCPPDENYATSVSALGPPLIFGHSSCRCWVCAGSLQKYAGQLVMHYVIDAKRQNMKIDGIGLVNKKTRLGINL